MITGTCARLAARAPHAAYLRELLLRGVHHRVDHDEGHDVDAEEEAGEPPPHLAFVVRVLPVRGHRSLWTFVLEAWARGRRTRRSTLTWLGRVTAQVMVSATSSAVSGSATPWWAFSAFSWSPPKRVRANSSVLTMPGATS